jgi:hypothetical protein
VEDNNSDDKFDVNSFGLKESWEVRARKHPIGKFFYYALLFLIVIPFIVGIMWWFLRTAVYCPQHPYSTAICRWATDSY